MLKEEGDEAGVKAKGKVMTKGKDYIVEDGDICYFKSGMFVATPHRPYATNNANYRVGESLEEHRMKAVANCSGSRDHDGKGVRLMRRWMTMSSKSVILLYIHSWKHACSHSSTSFPTPYILDNLGSLCFFLRELPLPRAILPGVNCDMLLLVPTRCSTPPLHHSLNVGRPRLSSS